MLLEKIREATATNHKKLEAQLFPFISAIESTAHYAKLLYAFYGYIKPVQEKVLDHIDPIVVPDIAGRRNADLIVKDLALLGYPTPVEFSESLPPITDHPGAMGALYVLEGSTLGGKIISKTISEKLGNTTPLNFFKGYGPETGPKWKDFTQQIEHPVNHAGAERLIQSAVETFGCFGTWFENYLFKKNNLINNNGV
ncbi:MAG: heme oxygenase [Chitinophagaceae bacterium]|nr:MAG: heme oxygenase [Chitinophagaceae bacterium]